MDYVYDLTIETDDTEDNPAELELPTFSGIVHLVEIEMPPGCGGLVYAAIRQGLHQVWPSNPEGAYRSDGRVYSTREHYPVGRDAPSLVLQGWADGTSYPHTVQFRISVLPVEVMEPMRKLESKFQKFLKALGMK